MNSTNIEISAKLLRVEALNSSALPRKLINVFGKMARLKFLAILRSVKISLLLGILCLLSAMTSSSRAEPPLADSARKFAFVKNYSKYVLNDKAIYESLAKLAATKPQYSPDKGLGNLYEEWSSVEIFSDVDSKETKYSVEIHNTGVVTSDEKFQYEIGLIFLCKITGRGEQKKTERYGLYNDKIIIQSLIHAVCEKAGCALPNPVSAKPQAAPGTESRFTVMDVKVYDALEDAINKSKLDLVPPLKSHEAEFAVLLPLPPHRQNKYYYVFAYDTPGILRVMKVQKSDDGKITKSELGIMKNQEIWLTFCERFAVSQK